jgi:hypothetical protein
MSATVKTKKRDANGATDGGEPNATAKPSVTSPPQSAAAPSPFTPIADYAFLSDCHTGAARPAGTSATSRRRSLTSRWSKRPGASSWRN